jgi:hypothetical protein
MTALAYGWGRDLAGRCGMLCAVPVLAHVPSPLKFVPFRGTAAVADGLLIPA